MIVLVAYIHYFEGIVDEPQSFGDGFYNNLMIMMTHVVSRATVPAFFLISGYYFFYKGEFNISSYRKKLQKRFSTLFLPYVIWITLFILVTVVMMFGGRVIREHSFDSVISYFSEHGWLNMYWNCETWPFRFNWVGQPLDSSGPIFVPLWFVRDLMVCCLLSPIIHWCIKNLGMIFLIVLLFRYVSGLIPSIPGFSVNVYFVVGAYLAIKGKNIIVQAHKWKVVAYIAVLVMFPFMLYFDGSYTDTGNIIYPFWVFALVIVYFNVATSIVSRGWLKQPPSMSKSTFFIYCLHTFLIMGYSSKLMHKLIPSTHWFLSSIRYILVPLLCVAVCYAIYLIMNKYAPKILTVLTGDRN